MVEDPNVTTDTGQGHSYLTSPTVEVVVGNDISALPRTFFVHAELLTSNSSFFAKALRNYANTNRYNNDTPTKSRGGPSIHWKEGEEGMVKLPLDEPDVFASYAQYLYSGKLPTKVIYGQLAAVPQGATEEDLKNHKNSNDAKVLEAVQKMYSMLAKLYVFCERIQDTTAKATLLTTFIENSSARRDNGINIYPINPTVTIVYSGTSASDPLRELLVQNYVYIGHPGWAPRGHDDFPHEFLYDLMLRMLETRKVPADKIGFKDKQYFLDLLQKRESEQDEDRDMEDGD